MRILFLSQRFLLPMDRGGKIRTGKILEQLSRRHEVTLVSNYEAARDAPYLPGLDAMCARFVPVPWTEVPRFTARFFARLALQMFSRYPVNALNDFSRPLERAVLETLAADRYDVAVCDFVQSALMFRAARGVPTVLFQHNVEAMILERHVERAGNAVARLFWWLQWRKMLAYERRMCRAFDRVIAVSEADREIFERLYGVRHAAAIPTGVDTEFFAPPPGGGDPAEPGRIVFCGSMDWLPNEDGILFFVDEVLPRIRERVPGATLTVVGRNPSPRLRRLVQGRPEVELTGWVDDTRPYLARAAVCVVPLRIGGGTRMKIYEAMAMAKAVVSTRIGAEGLEVRDGHDIELADEAPELADRVAALLTDAPRRRRLERAARAVAERFSWARIAERFEAICEEAARAGRGAP